MAKAYFTKELFAFLTDLRRNNDREWFKEQKERFESVARDPFLQLIRDLGPRLAKLSPNLVADPRPSGGSMMRMYRDTRFSADKAPLRTGIAARFLNSRAPKDANPGFYLHLEPGESGLGAGLWRPEPGALKQIRDAIATDPKGWEKAAAKRRFQTGCGMIGESLKRPPAGYDPNHPAIEDLKRKDFAISVPLTDRDVVSAGLLDLVVERYREQVPFVRFLSDALDVEF
ncbi:MAG: TIGR02453 family protein [Myxococcales bacterium]